MLTFLSLSLCALAIYLGLGEQRDPPGQSQSYGVALAVLGVAALTATLSFWPVISRPGWPHNHEALSWAFRVDFFADAARAGDPLPIWSARDAYSLGTAFPLLYHRLFNLAGASLFLVTGSMKLSVLLTLIALAATGVVGMYRACREAGIGVTVAALVAATFPHANYAATNWLIRGAMAEYAAFCFLPWALWWSICLIRRRVFKWQIVLILTALAWAHTLIAYFTVLLLGIAFLLALALEPRRWRALLLPALGWGALFAALNAPLLALTVAFGRYANLGALSRYTPTNEFKPLAKYFQDGEYRWDGYMGFYTLQLDTWLLVGAAVCALLCVAIAALPLGDWPGQRRLRAALVRGRPVIGFAALLFALFLWLQHPSSAPFYTLVPGASFVQFPWRLLTFLSALLLLLLALGADALARASRWLGIAILAGATISTIAMSTLRPTTYEWFTPEEVESQSSGAWVEYWPRPLDRDVIDNQELGPLLLGYVKRGPEQLAGAPCAIVEEEQAGYLRRAFEVRCPEPGLVALPIAYSGFERTLRGDTGEPLPHARTVEDPRIRVELPPGSYELEVCLPTLGRLITGPLGGGCPP